MLRTVIDISSRSRQPLSAISALPSFSGRGEVSADSPHQHSCWQQQQIRHISEEQLNADGSRVAELFEKNMARASRKREDTSGGPRILTARREALHLYREILRYSNLFVWRDDKGRVWRDIIRANARKEYEDARFEPDPEIINKLIITGRDAVQRVVDSFWRKRQAIIEEEDAAKQGGGGGPRRPPHG